MGLDELRVAAAGHWDLALVADLGRFGLTRSQIARLRREGWFVDVRRGVVALGGGRPTAWQQVVAASMAAGPPSALSHLTAARIHRFAGVAPRGPDGSEVRIELTAPLRMQPRLAGCLLHRVTHLPEQDVTVRYGVRVTTPLRTLVDLAPRLSPVVLEKTIDEGLISRLWDEPGLHAATLSARGRPGVGKLRRLMAARTAGQAGDSHLELTVTRALASLGPYETGYQVVVDGKVYVLDVAWPLYKVAAECDGWATRGRSRSKFDHERRKDNDLAAAGWSVVHLTSAMSADEMRAAVVKVLLRAAAAGGGAALGRP